MHDGSVNNSLGPASGSHSHANHPCAFTITPSSKQKRNAMIACRWPSLTSYRLASHLLNSEIVAVLPAMQRQERKAAALLINILLRDGHFAADAKGAAGDF